MIIFTSGCFLLSALGFPEFKNVLKLKTRVTRRPALLKKIYDAAKNKNTVTTTHMRIIAKKLKIKGSTTRIRQHVIELLKQKILEKG